MAQSKCIPDYEAGILKELKCPVCYEFMLPPIKLCQSGHNICGSCRPNLKNTCPTCRQPILEVRNISLETLARETAFPCRHHKSGCKQQIGFSVIKQHQSECSFGNHRCPFAKISNEKCDWCGRVPDMVKHIKEAHKANIQILNAEGSVQFQFNIPSPPSDQGNTAGVAQASQSTSTVVSKSAGQAILGLEEFFYVVFRVDEKTLYCVVMHVGSREDSTKFKYKLSLSSKKEEVTFTLITASFMDDVDKTFKDHNCVAVLAVSRFAERKILKPKIEILKCENVAPEKSTEDGEDEEESEDATKTFQKVKDLTLV